MNAVDSLKHESDLLHERRQSMTEQIIKPFLDRLIAEGVLPKVDCKVEWDVNPWSNVTIGVDPLELPWGEAADEPTVIPSSQEQA